MKLLNLLLFDTSLDRCIKVCILVMLALAHLFTTCTIVYLRVSKPNFTYHVAISWITVEFLASWTFWVWNGDRYTASSLFTVLTIIDLATFKTFHTCHITRSRFGIEGRAFRAVCIWRVDTG